MFALHISKRKLTTGAFLHSPYHSIRLQEPLGQLLSGCFRESRPEQREQEGVSEVCWARKDFINSMDHKSWCGGSLLFRCWTGIFRCTTSSHLANASDCPISTILLAQSSSRPAGPHFYLDQMSVLLANGLNNRACQKIVNGCAPWWTPPVLSAFAELQPHPSLCLRLFSCLSNLDTSFWVQIFGFSEWQSFSCSGHHKVFLVTIDCRMAGLIKTASQSTALINRFLRLEALYRLVCDGRDGEVRMRTCPLTSLSSAQTHAQEMSFSPGLSACCLVQI